MNEVLEKKDANVETLLNEVNSLKSKLIEVEKDKKLYEGWYHETKNKLDKFKDAVKSVIVLVD